MIRATFKIMIPLGKRMEVLKIFNRTVERTRIEPGCLSCNFYEDVQDKRRLVLDESWVTKVDLEHHLRSDDFRDLLLVAESSLQAPEIIFSEVIPGNSMEIIGKVREAGR